jgi:BMFP domain-containing protein YqiC
MTDDEEYAQNLAVASRILADEISPIRQDIEEEFRSMLGS